MKVLSRPMSVNATQVFKDSGLAKTLFITHDKYVVVPADKAQNNIVFICKTYYIQCLSSEVDAENNSSNTATTLSKDEIVENHNSVLSTFGLTTKDDDLPLYAGFLNSTRFHTNNATQLHLHDVPPNLFQNFLLLY